MKDLFEILEKLARIFWEHYLTRAKIRGAIYYIEGVRTVRRIFILACLLIFCLVVAALGLILIPVALCLYMPWTPEVKAGVAILFGLVYLLGSLAVLASLFSEKRWMKITRAKELLEKALKEV